MKLVACSININTLRALKNKQRIAMIGTQFSTAQVLPRLVWFCGVRDLVNYSGNYEMTKYKYIYIYIVYF